MLVCVSLYHAPSVYVYATYQAAFEVLLLILEVFMFFEHNCVSVKNKEKLKVDNSPFHILVAMEKGANITCTYRHDHASSQTIINLST